MAVVLACHSVVMMVVELVLLTVALWDLMMAEHLVIWKVVT